MLFQNMCGFLDCGKWHVRAFCDIQQTVRAIAQVEYPQHCHFRRTRVRLAANCAVQPASSELGLAPGIRIDHRAVLSTVRVTMRQIRRALSSARGSTKSRLSADV